MSAGVVIPKQFMASLCKARVDCCGLPVRDQKVDTLNG